MATVRLGLTLLVGAAIATSSGAAHAAAALVQNNVASGTTSVVGTWGTAVTAGHLLVAAISAKTGSTITAPGGWTSITSIDNTGQVMVAMYYIPNCSAKAVNSTETFTAGTECDSKSQAKGKNWPLRRKLEA